MTERERYEYIVNTLAELSETGYAEMQCIQTKEITFTSQKSQIIDIKNIDEKVDLTLTDGDIKISIQLPYLTFVDILERFNLLDNKLRTKIDVLFNKKRQIITEAEIDTLFKNNEHSTFETESGTTIQQINFSNKNKETMIPTEMAIATIEYMIDNVFPELKETVKVEIGNSREEVRLILKNGLEDPAFLEALPALILRKSFFENCKMWGIKKFIFIDVPRNGFDMIKIDDFDMENLY